MQETEQIDTRTDGPDNSSGILGLFTTVAQTAGQVYGEIAKANSASKIASAEADAKRAAASQPAVQTTPVGAQASTTTGTQTTWIKGVSNTVVIVAGIGLVLAALGFFAFRRK